MWWGHLAPTRRRLNLKLYPQWCVILRDPIYMTFTGWQCVFPIFCGRQIYMEHLNRTIHEILTLTMLLNLWSRTDIWGAREDTWWASLSCCWQSWCNCNRVLLLWRRFLQKILHTLHPHRRGFQRSCGEYPLLDTPLPQRWTFASSPRSQGPQLERKWDNLVKS